MSERITEERLIDLVKTAEHEIVSLCHAGKMIGSPVDEAIRSTLCEEIQRLQRIEAAAREVVLKYDLGRTDGVPREGNAMDALRQALGDGRE